MPLVFNNENILLLSFSWICLRSQLYDSSFDQSLTSQNVESSSQDKSWCSQADDWGDDDNFGSDISFGDFTVKSLQPEVGKYEINYSYKTSRNL